MRVGIGCNLLAKGLHSGHVDGIGVYTSELIKSFQKSEGVADLRRVVFGPRLAPDPSGYQALPLRYSVSALLSAASGLPFPGSSVLERDIDLFHATDHNIPKLRHTPVIATVMDVIGMRHPEWVNPTLRTLKNHLFTKATSWAQHLITISEFSAADIADCLGIDRSKITSIPLGVDEQYFQTVTEIDRNSVLTRYGLRLGYFVFVGTLQPRKNVSRIIAAHATLPAAMRRQHPLVVVGQNGWRTDELLRELAALEASGYGRWLQYVPRTDIFSVLQSAHALVFPSLYEGFGLPVLEAFASRIPVITSKTTSLPEVAGDAATLVNPESIESIADAMKTSITNDHERPIVIEKGIAQARRFTWQQTADLTLAAYMKTSL